LILPKGKSAIAQPMKDVAPHLQNFIASLTQLTAETMRFDASLVNQENRMSSPSSSRVYVGANLAALPSLFESSGEVPLLIGIEQDLRLMIEPAVSDPEAKHTLGMIRRIILDIVARRLEEPETAAMVRAARWDALQDLIVLARSLGEEGQKLANRLTNDLPPEGDQSDVSELLGAAFGDLAEVPGTEDSAFSAELGKILGRLLESETAVEASHRIAAERIEAQQKPGACDPDVITHERFGQFMREQLPDIPDLRVTRMTRPPMGWGKVTLIAELEGTNLPYSSVVIRQDAALSGTDTHVIDEYPIIKFVSDHGLQVPEPLFLSAETGRFGRPFIVMSKLSGATGGGLADQIRSAPARRFSISHASRQNSMRSIRAIRICQQFGQPPRTRMRTAAPLPVCIAGWWKAKCRQCRSRAGLCSGLIAMRPVHRIDRSWCIRTSAYGTCSSKARR
jgi:hypothetical protein